MVFKSSKQRKAVMMKLKNKSTNPTIIFNEFMKNKTFKNATPRDREIRINMTIAQRIRRKNN